MIDQVITTLKERLPTGAKVLDIGFGTGRISFKMANELPIISVTGIESASRNQIDGFIDESTFNCKCVCINNTEFKNFQTTDKYDLIVLFNVTHYKELGDHKEVIRRVSGMLNENGLLAISHKVNHSKGRQHIPLDDLMKELEHGFEILLCVETKREDKFKPLTDDIDARDERGLGSKDEIIHGAFRIVALKI